MESKNSTAVAARKIGTLTLAGAAPSTDNLVPDSSSLSSNTHQIQQKKVLGNIKLGNANFKVSQIIKDQSQIISEGAAKRHSQDHNQTLSVRQLAADTSEGKTSSQKSHRRILGDARNAKNVTIQRIKIRKEQSLSGEATDRNKASVTSQSAAASDKRRTSYNLGEVPGSAVRPASRKSKDQDEGALTPKLAADQDGARSFDNRKESDHNLNNLPLQIMDNFGKDEVRPRHQIQPKKTPEAHLKHEISQSTSSIFKMGLTSNEMTIEAPSITHTQSHSRNVLEENQKMEQK